MIMKLKGAYYQQIWLVRDVMNIFQSLSGTAGAGDFTNTDPDERTDCNTILGAGFLDLCDPLTVPPCATHVCSLDAGATTCVDSIAVDIPVALTGSSLFQLCTIPSVLPGDVAVIGSPSKGLDPVPLGAAGTACVLAVGAEGVIGCGSGQAEVSYSLCQDHYLQCSTSGAECKVDADCPVGQTCVDECETGAPGEVCAPDTADPMTGSAHSLMTNGGACSTFTTAAAVSGGAFVLNSTLIQVTSVGDEGGDTDPCTADDISDPSAVGSLPLTTATGTAFLIDANGVDGNVLPFGGGPCPIGGSASGSPFTCSDLFTSVMTGGDLAGAFTGLHALFSTIPTTPGSDTLTTFSLSCG
jgi:hypothetical protein